MEIGPGPLFIDDHLGWTTRDDEYSQPTAVIQMTTDGRTERVNSLRGLIFPPSPRCHMQPAPYGGGLPALTPAGINGDRVHI